MFIFTYRTGPEQMWKFEIDIHSEIPKYQQLVNAIKNAISQNAIEIGGALPSVNSLCKQHQLSRDTVFKAYAILKDHGVVEAVPNKGYFVASDTRKVILVLDTFKAYKEVLYHSFVQNLSKKYIVDVQFHHYNINHFKTILDNSLGNYYKYVVMNFDHKEVPEIIQQFEPDKLLLIDWNIHSKKDHNYVCQDFGNAFKEALEGATQAFKKYKKLVFVYPSFTNHPIETVTYFKKYCDEKGFSCKVIADPKDFVIKKGEAYLSVSDRILGSFLEQCRDSRLEPGVEVGFLSYNETPMKKFIYKGISVVSTDFNELGARAASFVNSEETLQTYVPTKLILRESL